MWKMLLMFGMPLLYPLAAVYALIVRALDLPDFLGILL